MCWIENDKGDYGRSEEHSLIVIKVTNSREDICIDYESAIVDTMRILGNS